MVSFETTMIRGGIARFSRALLMAALAVGAAGAARAEEPRYFAIRNARIVPVSGPEIKSGTVVVAKGLIVAVGEKVTIPPEAWVIEGRGLTVYPGSSTRSATSDLGPLRRRVRAVVAEAPDRSAFRRQRSQSYRVRRTGRPRLRG